MMCDFTYPSTFIRIPCLFQGFWILKLVYIALQLLNIFLKLSVFMQLLLQSIHKCLKRRLRYPVLPPRAWRKISSVSPWLGWGRASYSECRGRDARSPSSPLQMPRRCYKSWSFTNISRQHSCDDGDLKVAKSWLWTIIVIIRMELPTPMGPQLCCVYIMGNFESMNSAILCTNGLLQTSVY